MRCPRCAIMSFIRRYSSPRSSVFRVRAYIISSTISHSARTVSCATTSLIEREQLGRACGDLGGHEAEVSMSDDA